MENLKELRSLRAEKEVEADALLEEGKLEEGKSALEQIKELDARIAEVEEEIKKIKEEGNKEDDKKEDKPVVEKEDDIRSNKQEGETRMNFKPSINNENKDSESVRNLGAYIKTKGETRAGLVSDDVGITIPEDITFVPVDEVKTVQNLAELVNKVQVKAPSGNYPIKDRATAKFHTVAELEANPEL